jgi:putative FmdB family regulatory protein
MPIFEYACRRCSREFESIVHAAARVACPSCGSTELDKRLSVFAVGSAPARREAPGGACRTCGDPRGAGSCSLD